MCVIFFFFIGAHLSRSLVHFVMIVSETISKSLSFPSSYSFSLTLNDLLVQF